MKNKGEGGPPIMIMKAWMIVNQKAMMATMIKYVETQEVDSMDPEDLVMVMDLRTLRTH